MKKLRPLHDRIIVKRIEKKAKSAGGIYIPDSAKEKPLEGKIIAIGQGRTDSKGKLIPLTVKIGNVVLFTSYAGTEVTLDGEDYLIIREDDILAVAGK
jgi:chaperonin GroES